jgi:hypothetical protein
MERVFGGRVKTATSKKVLVPRINRLHYMASPSWENG